ncbi:MAG: leucine-rich repeat protein [Treponema sp.]|jgi:TolB-like protein|nr:leucine-rich repeat protein [Treponema sp.]
MKKRAVCLLVCALLGAALYAQAAGNPAGNPAGKPRLAILPFTGGSPEDTETIAEFFSFEPEINRVFTPVPRTRAIETLMKEQEFQHSGLTDSDTIAELGKQLNADYVLAGHIAELGGGKLLLITIINVRELQQIAGDYREYQRIEGVVDVLGDMAARIARAAARDTSRLPRLAVLPFNALSSGMDVQDAELLAQLLATEIANSGSYAVFPRTKAVEKVMEEHHIERSGMTDAESIRTIGEAVNAQYVLSANVRKLGADNYFSAAILHIVEASQGPGTREKYRTVRDGLEIMPRLAQSLTGAQPAVRETPLAAPFRVDPRWTPASDFDFSLDGDGLTLTKYKGSAASVNIPAGVDGIPVIAIGRSAFYDNKSLTSITIPTSVTAIGYYAFSRCSSLTAITVDAGNRRYSSVNGILFSKDGKTLVRYPAGKVFISYTIPADVTAIGNCAFYGCSNLTSITIPTSVMSIGVYAFSGCNSLTSITIPTSVTSIGYGAFSGCNSLTAITVETGNRQYSSVNGILFSKDGRTLVRYPAGKVFTSYTIPARVTVIGGAAFFGCFNLTSITIPTSVTAIGESAFRMCIRLTSITIPTSVTSIGRTAFSACFSLTSITIPTSVTSIEEGAFSRCSRLKSITIPNSITSIGEGAFAYCDSLSAIDREAIRRRFGDGVF